MIHAPTDWSLPPLSRIDPYARKVTSSIGNGIIYDPQAFNWGDKTFHMATWNELIIYEMHVGTFNLFVKAAHEQGIAVIVDVVYNHFGPGDLDLWRFDGWSENEKGGIYFYNDCRSETPWGDTRPDYGRDEVRQYLRNNALMWLVGDDPPGPPR